MFELRTLIHTSHFVVVATSENRDFRYDRFRKVSEGKRDRLVGYQFTHVGSPLGLKLRLMILCAPMICQTGSGMVCRDEFNLWVSNMQCVGLSAWCSDDISGSLVSHHCTVYTPPKLPGLACFRVECAWPKFPPIHTPNITNV